MPLGARPRGRARGLRAVRRLRRRAPPALPGHARLPLRAVRAHRAHAAHGRARHARGRRSTTSSAARCSSTSTASSKQALRASVDELLDQGRSRSSSGSSAPPTSAGGDESVVAFEDVARDRRRLAPRRDQRLQRGGLPLDSTSCTEWLLERRPGHIPWRLPPDERERSEEAEERDAERARVREALLAGAAEGDPRLAPRAPARLPPARGAAAVVGVLLPPRARRRGARREPAHPRRARAGRRAGQGEAVLVVPVDVPAAGAPDPRRRRRPADRALASTWRSTTSTGRSGSAGAATRRTSRSRPALIPPMPTGREAAAGGAPALRREPLSGTRPRSRSSSGARRRRGWTWTLGRRGAQPRPELPLRAGPARLGQDVERARGWRSRSCARGKRVGVTALSHKAIHKFLDDLEEAAEEAGYEFRGRKKGSGEGHYEGRFVDATDSNDAMLDPELQLLAGTSWLFAREELDRHVDTLFVDEGGQFALADALAVGTAARNLVLLGDPNQLPQVSQGSHPPGAEASVLQPPARRRRDGAARPRALPRGDVAPAAGGVRLRLGGVLRGPARAGGDHLDARDRGRERRPLPRRRARPGTARLRPRRRTAVRAEIDRLVGTPYVEAGAERPLGYEDFLVVAPVQRPRPPAPRGAARGGARRHGGQVPGPAGDGRRSSRWRARRARTSRAASTSSSPGTASTWRSRGRSAWPYVVASPRLLETRCRTVEQMRLVNALCRFVELAEEVEA